MKNKIISQISTLLLTFLLISFQQYSVAEPIEISQVLQKIEQAQAVDRTTFIRRLRPHLSTIKQESPNTQFRFFSQLALAYSHKDDLELSHKYHLAADQIAPASVFSSRAYALHLEDWAGNFYEQQLLTEGSVVLQRLYALADKYNDSITRLLTINMDLVYALSQDDWHRSSRLSEQAMDITFSSKTIFKDDNERMKYQSLTLQRTARLYREFHPSKTIELYELALPLQRKIKSLSQQESTLHYLAIFHLEAGNISQSRQYIQELLAFAKEYQRNLGFLSAYTSSSRLHLSMGNTQAAQQDILRAKVHLTHNTLPSLMQRYVLQKSTLLMLNGNPGAAVDLLAPKFSLFENSNFMQLRLQYLELLSSAYSQTQNLERANAIQREALKISMLWKSKSTAFHKEQNNIH